MVYLPENVSKRRLREAENARKNRAEIVAARSQGQASRRDLFKWGAITAGGLLVCKNGLSPFAPSAYADGVPTGTPRSPMFGAVPFKAKMLRFDVTTPIPLVPVADAADVTGVAVQPAPGLQGKAGILAAQWGRPATRKARTEKGVQTIEGVRNDPRGPAPASTGPYGPLDGRPPGEFFAHQRWTEFLPKVGFLLSTGQIAPGTTYFGEAADAPPLLPNSVWTFGQGRFVQGALPPQLVKARYGEPVLLRHYNNMPFELENNGGFGRQEPSTHNHNAHNGAESDGAQNSFFFPGQFYDYHWSTTMARHDKLGQDARTGIQRGNPRCSGPDDNGGIVQVGGDFREIQGTMWFHDHRFFFTSENVYKGFAAMLNYYSGPDRGYEHNDLQGDAAAVNLQLPSGFLAKNADESLKKWGNQDFDVNLLIQDVAFDPEGQLFFDVFDTDGFLGDVLHVNFRWKPVFEVLPRKYRFRILSAGMSRWIALAFVNSNGTGKSVKIIGNDGNLFPPLKVGGESAVKIDASSPWGPFQLGKQATAERFDVIVDFSNIAVGGSCYLVNTLQHSNGKKADGILSLADALSGKSPDPAVGKILKFQVVNKLRSVDDPTKTIGTPDSGADVVVTGSEDQSYDGSNPARPLQVQIPIITPDRTRILGFDRNGNADGGLPFDHREGGDPWAVSVNNGPDHHLDDRRSSNLPEPGAIEHWTLKNGGGGWDHPLHLHFEEGVTFARKGGEVFPPSERMKRKDVWRPGEAAEVTFQVQFGEYGGAYVNHCHNTVHEDNAMLIRYDLQRDDTEGGTKNIKSVHTVVLPTPDPRPDGVRYVQSCSLPEGNPQGAVTGIPNCPPGAIGPVVKVDPVTGLPL